jgi:hypothetical protein
MTGATITGPNTTQVPASAHSSSSRLLLYGGPARTQILGTTVAQPLPEDLGQRCVVSAARSVRLLGDVVEQVRLDPGAEFLHKPARQA